MARPAKARSGRGCRGNRAGIAAHARRGAGVTRSPGSVSGIIAVPAARIPAINRPWREEGVINRERAPVGIAVRAHNSSLARNVSAEAVVRVVAPGPPRPRHLHSVPGTNYEPV